MSPTGVVDLFAASPYRKPLVRLSMTATGSISEGATAKSGFGVMCRQGTGSERVQYEFVLKTSGKWIVYLRTGEVSLTTPPMELRTGMSPTTAGSTPVQLTASCTTGSDGHTTHLVFVVAGSTVVDFTDSAAGLTGTGWLGYTEAAIGPPQATVTFTKFEERDLPN